MSIKALRTRRENINQHVQMYALILSDILLGQQSEPHFRDIRDAIAKVNGLIANHPNTQGYRLLKEELLHLKKLVDDKKLKALSKPSVHKE